ncbi:MAG: DNA repair protein RecO [Myxococcales bacterium]|nr:DNA repair protein RecO [Myxococcales bacterium]
MAGRHFTTPAIVLRRYAFGESDRLVVLLTPGHGLVRALAKGQRRSFKRFGGILDLLYFLEADLTARKSEIQLLDAVRLADAYRPLSEDLMLYAAGCHLAEVAAAFASEMHADEQAFAALTGGLAELCRGTDPNRVGRVVELHTLRAAGLAPRLDTCGVTGRRLGESETVAFEPHHGGAVTAEKASLSSIRLSARARRTLQAILAADFAAALSLEWERADALAARTALAQMIAYHSGRVLKVRQFAEAAARFSRRHRRGATAPVEVC